MIAVFPGSFDPITNGHLDVIERGARLVDGLIIAVHRNEAKQPLFAVDERLRMAAGAVAGIPNVTVDSFEGLLVNYAASKQAKVVLRGIRAVSDYEYELQMARMNRRLNPAIETIFLLAGESHSFISSRLVKEVARLGGDIHGLVPAHVEQAFGLLKPNVRN
jgi:pantetheine-phosphate adenylyltransferase